ncbi:hypothetical protein BV97_04455 [Novosphingobium resinovorum]|nr:hypothetical protein BV97_04455 [Novosphingobium resinovorum]
MSAIAIGSTAAGAALCSRYYCHASRFMGAGLVAVGLLLIAEPA